MLNAPKAPIYIRPDYRDALKVEATLENKKLYQLCEEVLAPHIENFRASRLPEQQILTNEEAK